MQHDPAEDLRRAAQLFFRRFGVLSADTTPCGKPLSIAHAHALLTLLTSGELSQQQLARELCIDKSNVARLCAKMVEDGQALQRSNAQDARGRLVSLTARGEQLAKSVDASSRARFAALLDQLPGKRRPQIIEALELLAKAIESLPAPGAAVSAHRIPRRGIS